MDYLILGRQKEVVTAKSGQKFILISAAPIKNMRWEGMYAKTYWLPLDRVREALLEAPQLNGEIYRRDNQNNYYVNFEFDDAGQMLDMKFFAKPLK